MFFAFQPIDHDRMRIAGTLVAIIAVVSLTACGTTDATSAPASSAPAPVSTSPAAAKSSPAAPSSAACHGGPDVDVVRSLEAGGWTGVTSPWCFGVSGQSQIAIATKGVAIEREQHVQVECDIIALDSKNPQFAAWVSGDQSRRPHLNGVIAEIGNC